MEDYRLKAKERAEASQLAITTGDFETESEGVIWISDFIRGTGLFKVHYEVPGYILQPRFGTQQTRVRADLLLLPTEKGISAGWSLGAVLIECKAPGKSIGKTICQCLDYLRSAYTLKASGVTVVPTYAFIWHAQSLHGSLSSVATGNRIGTIERNNYGVKFMLPSLNIMHFDLDCGLISMKQPMSGNKAGSR